MADTTETTSMDSMDDKILLQLLAQKHSGYDVAAKRAKEGLDFYSGERDELVTDEFLPRGNAEETAEHNKRKDLTEPMPVTPKTINEVAGAVFEPDPSYEVPPEMQEYLKNANIAGDSHARIMIDLCCEVMAAGFYAVLVDSTLTPELAEGRASKADEKAIGARAVLKTYDPRGIRNWGYDNKGLAWIHLCETHVVQESFIDTQMTQEEHLIVDRANIFKVVLEIGVNGSKKVKEKAIIPHGLDVVPVETLAFVKDKKLGPGAGKRFIRTSIRADLASLRSNSYRSMGLLIHGTPLMYRRFSEVEWETIIAMHDAEMTRQGKAGAPLDFTWVGNQIKLGTSGYAILQGAESAIGYATVDVGPLKALKEAEQDYSSRAQAEAGFDDADIWGTKANVSQQSGIAKAFSYSTKQGVQLELISLLMSVFDNKVLRLVAMKLGLEKSDDVQATYKQPRIVAPLGQLIQELELVEDWGIPEITAGLRKRMLDRIVLLDGENPEVKARYAKLIDDMPEQKSLTGKMNPAIGSEDKQTADTEQES